MKVSISKSKNTTIYYLSKSVRIGSKTTTKTIEKIGTYDEIKEKCGDMEPLEWAKQYAAQRTAEEKDARQDVVMKYSSSTLIKKINAVHATSDIFSSRTFIIPSGWIKSVPGYLKNTNLTMI